MVKVLPVYSGAQKHICLIVLRHNRKRHTSQTSKCCSNMTQLLTLLHFKLQWDYSKDLFEAGNLLSVIVSILVYFLAHFISQVIPLSLYSQHRKHPIFALLVYILEHNHLHLSASCCLLSHILSHFSDKNTYIHMRLSTYFIHIYFILLNIELFPCS